LWTTAWATNSVTPGGWVGLVVGVAIGIPLAFHPMLRFPDKPYLDRAIPKLIGAICAFTGLLAGALIGAAWARPC
jgi:hypothetical protein